MHAFVFLSSSVKFNQLGSLEKICVCNVTDYFICILNETPDQTHTRANIFFFAFIRPMWGHLLVSFPSAQLYSKPYFTYSTYLPTYHSLHPLLHWPTLHPGFPSTLISPLFSWLYCHYFLSKHGCPFQYLSFFQS